MKNKYIDFLLIEVKPKTQVYQVLSKSQGTVLGIIKWFNRWRQYCFFPNFDTVFNNQCMKDVCKFIEELKKKD